MKKKVWIVSICLLLLLGCAAHVAALSGGFDLWPFSDAKENCAHTYIAIVSVEATCTTNGEVVYSCNKCGDTKTQSHAAFGHTVSDGWCVLCGMQANASEGLEYRYSSELGGYIVTGIGTCTDTIIKISDTYKEKPVVMIGEKAFKGCGDIKSVEIPDTVKSIAPEAFANCKELTGVTFSSTSMLDKIDDKAFFYCVKLSNINFPESLTYIGTAAFKYCPNIATDLVIPDAVTTLGGEAFFACYHIRSLKIGTGITQILNDTFFCCVDLETLILPATLTSVGDWGFYDCANIKTIHFGGSQSQWSAIQFGNKVGLPEITPTYNSQG